MYNTLFEEHGITRSTLLYTSCMYVCIIGKWLETKWLKGFFLRRRWYTGFCTRQFYPLYTV